MLVRNIADRAGGPTRNVDLVLEGGGLEFDGTGRCLVTRSSLLNDNRNPEVSEELATQRLCAAYGVRDVHWLDGTLTNDHTDGHIDTLARFIAPGEVVCVAPDPHKPNHAALASIYDGLSQLCAQGALKAVHTVPAPEPVLASDGTPLPASHMNFYIANHAVIVPAYGIASDAVVHEKLRSIIADRPVVLSPARQILEGGGALHCITRDWPRLP